MKRKIILDCDPGQDDAIALFLAYASSDELDVLGVSSVAGNVGLEKTTRNARILSDLAGRTDIHVYAGCAAPLLNQIVSAEHVHGKEGIDGVELFDPKTPLSETHAVDFIIETLLAAEVDEITLVPTGPLTNIAVAIRQEPAILPKIREIVLMGGAKSVGGNVTPSAEFNIYFDPHAAHIVMSCGRPIAVFGLDVTHQLPTTAERLDRIKAIGSPAAQAAHGLLTFYGAAVANFLSLDGPPLHDPCTIAYLLDPTLFTMKPCNIRVETSSELTMGHTAVDLLGVTGLPVNAVWATRVDDEAFYDLLISRIARL
ncbi:MAG: nucleoside hydrolase [Pseudomonadota bacterium]